MTIFLAMAALLPNCVVEIVTGCAKRHFSAPFEARARIISFLVWYGNEDADVRFEDYSNSFHHKDILVSKKYLSDSSTNMVPDFLLF